MIIVKRMISDYLSSNMYIVQDGNHCIIVDPCDTGLCKLDGTTVDYLFLTHEHFDHISGTTLFSEKFDLAVCAGSVCAQRITSPVLNCSRHFNAFAILRGQPCLKAVGDYSCSADLIVSDGEKMFWRDHCISFIYTPGHTDSGFSLYMDGMLFTGDTIMLNKDKSPVEPDRHFTESFYNITIPFLCKLPESTIIYPGHGDRFLLNEYLPMVVNR